MGMGAVETFVTLLMAPPAAVIILEALMCPSLLIPATLITAACLVTFGVKLHSATLQFSTEAKPFVVVKSGATEKEVRPPSDAVFHVLFFVWGVFGRGWVYQHMLRKLNSAYDTWDTPFAALGLDATAAVRGYCEQYGVQQEPWVWSKPASEYRTFNEWFARRFVPSLSPEANLGNAAVLT